nr:MULTISPECIES: antitoxin Xre/MbcA/ParS toxin-binding domain-containing protein [unclassified Dietzia]
MTDHKGHRGKKSTRAGGQKLAGTSGRTAGRAGEAGGSLTYLRILEEVADSGISRTELGKVVGAAERTVQTWVAGTSKPTGVRAQRLLDVQLIVRLLGETYTREGIKIWLNSRNRNLDLRRPIDLLEDGQIDAVLQEVTRIAGGM